MTLEATQLLQEMATFSKVFLASNIKDNLEASSPAGLYLALGRFIHLAQIGSPSYQELKEDWKINPDKTSPQRLAAFDTYLGNNQINSVNLFYQPLSYKDKSPELTKALSASNTIFVHNQGDLNMIVNEKTKGGIKEVKLPTDIENTQVLYNILSFKFIWYINFVREEELSDFVVNRGERLKVSYMSTLENFVTTATNDYKAAKLDFIKDPNAINKEPLEDFSAYLVRLKSGKPLHEIWEEVHQKLSQEEKIKIRIKLPAFRTEQETEFESTMFPKLLQERNNDFPIIAKAASTDSLKIKMKQKTFVCVDEKGSVGGGVTSVHGGNFAAGPRTLEFNEAFYYIIAGNKVATPLFVSYVTKGMTDLKESCTKKMFPNEVRLASPTLSPKNKPSKKSGEMTFSMTTLHPQSMPTPNLNQSMRPLSSPSKVPLKSKKITNGNTTTTSNSDSKEKTHPSSSDNESQPSLNDTTTPLHDSKYFRVYEIS
ncbi:hypothetical protein HMI55_002646, partial [Coelomomyces lativittatus]